MTTTAEQPSEFGREVTKMINGLEAECVRSGLALQAFWFMVLVTAAWRLSHHDGLTPTRLRELADDLERKDVN